MVKGATESVTHSFLVRFINVDSRLCNGCGLCELACSLVKEGSCNPSLSRIHVAKDHERQEFKLTVCHQCVIPYCMSVCSQDAIKVKYGALVILEGQCTGCGLCGERCPFNSNQKIIFAHPLKSVYVKCDLCIERQDGPACVSVCPTGAISLKEKKSARE
jgi:Fe-S-cluster-containing hydrogenase component 2